MFVTLALVSASCCLAEIRQLGRRGATWELEAEYKFQRRSCKLSFLFPPAASWAPRRARSPAIPNCVFFYSTSSNKLLQSKKIRISLIGGLDLTIVEICGRTSCDKSCKNSMEWNDYFLFCFCSSMLYFPAILMPMQSAVITQIGRRTWSAQHTLHGLGPSPLTGELPVAMIPTELCLQITCEHPWQTATYWHCRQGSMELASCSNLWTSVDTSVLTVQCLSGI